MYINDIKTVLYNDATTLQSWIMNDLLPHDEHEMCRGHPTCCIDNLGYFLNTPEDSNIGFFFGVDLRYADDIKGKQKKILFAFKNKVSHQDEFIKHIKGIKANKYSKNNKLISEILYHYIDADAFILRLNTKDISKDLPDLEDLFYSRNLSKSHERFGNKNTKLIGKPKMGNLKKTGLMNLFVQEVKCMHSKVDMIKKMKLKGVGESQIFNLRKTKNVQMELMTNK